MALVRGVLAVVLSSRSDDALPTWISHLHGCALILAREVSGRLAPVAQKKGAPEVAGNVAGWNGKKRASRSTSTSTCTAVPDVAVNVGVVARTPKKRRSASWP